MGKTQNLICQIALTRYPQTASTPLSKLIPESLKQRSLADGMRKIYNLLGGVLPEVPIPKSNSKWDFCTTDFILEIDEENHFNRYRAITLDSSLYSRYTGFPVTQFRQFCQARELYCQARGGYWKNESTERQFGPSDPDGVLAHLGSSRWKQRAFYDFLKDMSFLTTEKPIIRISVWDQLKLSNSWMSVKEVLKRRTPEFDSAVLALIEERLLTTTNSGQTEGFTQL